MSKEFEDLMRAAAKNIHEDNLKFYPNSSVLVTRRLRYQALDIMEEYFTEVGDEEHIKKVRETREHYQVLDGINEQS